MLFANMRFLHLVHTPLLLLLFVTCCRRLLLSLISRSRLFEKWKYKIILSIDNKYSVEERKNTQKKQTIAETHK